MSAKKLIPIGSRFHRWVVLENAPSTKNKSRMYLCRCDCGTVREVLGIGLFHGVSKSCGCFKDEATGARARTHGMSHTATFRCWQNMLNRCHNKNATRFENYGGRGIEVCERWRFSFANFLADMGEAPTGLTIERNDNNGNYEPGNCRWASRKEQGNNQRKTTFLIVNGEEKSMMQWCEIYQIKPMTVRSRLRYGWSVERAVTTPISKEK